jgi:hypothetical protein
MHLFYCISKHTIMVLTCLCMFVCQICMKLRMNIATPEATSHRCIHTENIVLWWREYRPEVTLKIFHARKIRCKGVNWIQPAYERVKWWAFMNTVNEP